MCLPRRSIAFWLLGVAVSLGYTAITSELSRLADDWGNGVLLHINLAFYLPSLPLLLLGATLDRRFDERFGRHRSTTLRVTAGFGGCAAVLAAFPFLQGSLHHLLAAVALLGVCSAAAASSSYQLATRQRDAGSSTVSVALGYVCSAPVVLLVEASWHLAQLPAWLNMLFLYETVAAINVASLAAAVAIVRRQQLDEQAWQGGGDPLLQLRRSRDWAEASKRLWLVEGTTAAGTPAASAGPPRVASPTAGSEDEEALFEGSSAGGGGAAFATLLAIWPLAASLALSVATSMFLFPLFTHFRSSGVLGDATLPAVLFWVRAFADIGGRLLPKLRIRPPGPSAVLCLALARLLLLPLPLLRVAGLLPGRLQSDWLLVLYVAVQWLGSGAISAWAFLLLPHLAPPELAPQAAATMTLVFNAACLVGLLLAIPAQSLVS